MRRFPMLASVLFLAAASVAHADPADGSCEEADAGDAAGSLVAELGRIATASVTAPVTARHAIPPPSFRDELPFRGRGVPDAKLATALRAWERARAAGLAPNPRLTIIDYSRPSTERRLWVIDPRTGRVLFHELVAHGQGSGGNRAERFGNTTDSHRTSLGVFTTAETYRGRHGLSLRLDGRDPGVNDRARARAIVIHAAEYATDRFVRAHGRLGRSHGCPAVDPAVSRALVDEVKGGSVVVAFGGDDAWIARSPLARP